MQTIRQLDENYADVLDHREHHLAKTFCLGFGATAELDLVEFADAVNDQRDLLPELFPDLFE